MFKITLALLFLAFPAFAQDQGLNIVPSIVGTSARGQIPGTATNDNANAGNIGEVVSSVIPSASQVNVPGSTAGLNLTSIALTSGDWDLSAQPVCVSTINGVPVTVEVSVSTTTNVMGIAPFLNGAQFTQSVSSRVTGMPIAPSRISIASGATYYLVAANYSVNAIVCWGEIRARRIR